jgi:pyrimidine-nucleoside phosphorylase
MRIFDPNIEYRISNIEVQFAGMRDQPMRAVDIIARKRDGGALSAAEIDAFIRGATHGSWPDYQLSALLMAIYLRGMTAEETAALTRSMAHSGVILDLSDLPGPKVDKHSTGGVGDKTSLILAPLAAACGVCVPKMSGRSLGHAGGTLDKLESIPGFRANLDIPEFRAVLRQVGCALVGQTKDIAPADKVLYALRDVTAAVESAPLITASIMSKKIAEGISGLVLDVKCGRGAYMKTRAAAAELARSLVYVGRANGLDTVALMTNMEAPLGCAVGNALEVIECLETLKGRGPADLEALSVTLAGHMLRKARPELPPHQTEQEIRAALTSGRGLDKFAQVIAAQGGDPAVVDDYSRFPAAAHQMLLRAKRAGYVSAIDAEAVGWAAMRLGAGREQKQDRIDHSVGVVLKVRVGEYLSGGEPVAEVHYRDQASLAVATELIGAAVRIGDAPPAPAPLILAVL